MSQLTEQWGKAYTAPDITVYYDAGRCLHFAACLRGLPQVFNPQTRPWIQADRAAAPELAEVIRRCPTGALHYALTSRGLPGDEMSDETQDERPQIPTTVELSEDGPLLLRGALSIATPQGVREETRAALCRCGASSHKPFCDGSHRAAQFQAPGSQHPGTPPGR